MTPLREWLMRHRGWMAAAAGLAGAGITFAVPALGCGA